MKLQPVVLSALRKAFPDVKKPTTIQKNMLALLNSDLSVLVRSAAGTGKSLATVLFLLSFVGHPYKSSSPYITNLLIVPTPDLAAQYYSVFESLLKDTPLDINKVVQHVYRCDEGNETRQINLLKANPGPRILIGTPTRILDILASPELRETLPLNNLSCIAMDEIDQLLPRKDVFFNPKMQRNTLRSEDSAIRVPAQILLNHIVPWRNTHVKNNNEYFTPLRFIFESSTASSYAKLVALRHNWITGRPMLRLGLDNAGGELRKRVPRDVSNYFVTYDPTVDILRDTVLPILEEEVVHNEKFLEAVKEINERRKKEIIKEAGTLAPAKKQEIISKYVDTLCKILKKDSKRALIVIPDSFSISTFLKMLSERGKIQGATSRFSETENGIVFTNSEGKSISVDSRTVFTEPDTPNTELPQVLVYRAKGCVGLDFPGLSRIYALSWDSILSSKLYVSLAGRCRAAPIEVRDDFHNEPWKPSSDPEQGKFVVISLAEEESEEHEIRLAASMAKIQAQPDLYCA